MRQTNLMTEKEQLAHTVLGETNAEIYQDFVIEGKNREQLLKEAAANQHNKMVEEYSDRYQKYSDEITEYAKKINENADSIEIKPLCNYVLVKPFNENPFQRIVKSESGIILDVGGLRPEFKNTDTGEYQEEEQMIIVGVVQEVGPDCKYLQRGDTVMYPKTRAAVLPFYKLGYVWINETGIMAVINEGLEERFNKYRNDGKK